MFCQKDKSISDEAVALKINLARSAGFCFGVKRAIDIAFKTAASEYCVCMLTDIVHNEDVIKEIKARGIRKIKALVKGKNKALLIPAHGVGAKTIDKARTLGYKIIDATCLKVKEIHKIARSMEGKGYRIIVIGDKAHDEVRGIIGQLKSNAIVIDSLDKIPLDRIVKNKKVAVVVQSTQNLEEVLKIIDILKSYIKELKFFNTICSPTLVKQEEIKRMPLENEVMLIIGSKNSANTKRLYELSKSRNPRSFWVQSKKNLDLGWFKGVQSVGVTAGASTPDSVIKDILEYLKTLVANRC